MLQKVYSDPKFTYIHRNSDKSSSLSSKAGEVIQYNGMGGQLRGPPINKKKPFLIISVVRENMCWFC